MTSPSQGIHSEFDSSLVDLVQELNIEIIDDTKEEDTDLKQLEQIEFLTENDFAILQKIIDDNAYRFKQVSQIEDIFDKIDPLVKRKSPEKRHSPAKHGNGGMKKSATSRFHPYKHWRPWQRNQCLSQCLEKKRRKIEA